MAATARLLPVEVSKAGSIASRPDCYPQASNPVAVLGRPLPSHSSRQRCLANNAGRCLPTLFWGKRLQGNLRQIHAVRAPPACSQGRSLRASSAGDKGTIAVAGGTGFIGSKLVEKLLDEGYKVKVLTRSADKARSVFSGKSVEIAEPHQWNQALAGTTGVVNLVGTPIATRWNEEVKADIKASRIKTTKRLVDAINALPENQRPKAFVSSSALGYYGISDTARFVEDSPSGNDYLAQVCREWEAAAKGVNGPRLVLVRTGIVLDKDGGALAKMIPLFQLFAGGPLGSGRQWFSWVHRDDLANLIIEALQNPKYEGPVNGTAPNPVTLGEMCDKLGQALGRPSWLPVPDFAVRSLLGEGASTQVLEGQRVLPKKAQDLGFTFKYPEISGALRAIVAS